MKTEYLIEVNKKIDFFAVEGWSTHGRMMPLKSSAQFYMHEMIFSENHLQL